MSPNILAGAVIGFLIAKIDGVIAAIGKTDEPIPMTATTAAARLPLVWGRCRRCGNRGGAYARGTGNHGVAVGTEASTSNVKAAAIGYRAKGEGDSGVAVGNESRAARKDSVAIGRKAYAAYASSVAIGAGSRGVDSNEVSFGYQGSAGTWPATRRLASAMALRILTRCQ